MCHTSLYDTVYMCFATTKGTASPVNPTVSWYVTNDLAILDIIRQLANDVSDMVLHKLYVFLDCFELG